MGSSRRSSTKFELSTLLPSIIIFLVGIITAGMVATFYDDQSSDSERIYLSRLGNEQSNALSSAISALDSDAVSLSRSNQVIGFILKQTNASNAALSRSLIGRSTAQSAFFSAPGQAQVDTSGKTPITFTAVNMITYAETQKETPPVEALQVNNQWLVFRVVPIYDNNTLLGTLLLTYPLESLTQQLPPFDQSIAKIELIQKFPNTPAQTLYSAGKAKELSAPFAFETSNPHWSLSITAGPRLATSGSWISTAIGIGIALIGLIGAYLLWVYRAKNHHDDYSSEPLDDFHLERLKSQTAVSKKAAPIAIKVQPTQNGRAVFDADLAASGLIITEDEHPPAVAPSEHIAEDLNKDVFAFLDLDISKENEVKSQPMNSSIKSPAGHLISTEIFRAYDIRGIINQTLNTDVAYWVGRAIGAESLAHKEPNVAVARDGRLSSPALSKALIQGLLESGCHVSDIGMVPTPVLYFATNVLKGRSGVMLTGSHNPPDYNGFKVVIAGDTLSGERITALARRIQDNQLEPGQAQGQLKTGNLLPTYIERITTDIKLKRPLKVVIDCGNGVTGVVAPELYKKLGCDVIPLYCEVDGNFPNHHPDPSKAENVKDLIAAVAKYNADVGLAFDGDGDRVAIITNTGNQPFADHLLKVFTKDVLARNPGAEVIYDVKCSRRLTQVIQENGGKPTMWRTGHSLIKAKMKETGALLAGEMSGHIFFKERWYGFDDGLYAGARLLEILANSNQPCQALFDQFPTDASTPEINITVSEANKFQYIQRLQEKGFWGDGKTTTIDGIRVDYSNGWGLIRASNTTPVLVLRFEGETAKDVEQIKSIFREQLKEVVPEVPVFI